MKRKRIFLSLLSLTLINVTLAAVGLVTGCTSPLSTPTSPTDNSTNHNTATTGSFVGPYSSYHANWIAGGYQYTFDTSGAYYVNPGSGVLYFISNEVNTVTNFSGRIYGKIYTNNAATTVGRSGWGTWLPVSSTAYGVIVFSNVIASSTAYFKKIGSPAAPVVPGEASSTNNATAFSTYPYTSSNYYP